MKKLPHAPIVPKDAIPPAPPGFVAEGTPIFDDTTGAICQMYAMTEEAWDLLQDFYRRKYGTEL